MLLGKRFQFFNGSEAVIKHWCRGAVMLAR
jgi:hypothetical protein